MNCTLRPVLFIFVFLGTLFLSIDSFSQCTTLVWSDEFDGTTLDQTKWAYALGRGCDQPSGCGFGNGEEQAYTNLPKNITVGGGNLTITAIFDNPQAGAAFSSAKIQTVGLKTFQYGKIEARMKLPSGQGAWPAFWMLAQNNNWPFTGEIDIMEAKHRNPTQVMGTVHHYNGHTTGQLTTPDLSAAFHTYAIEWERDEIRWYFDDELYHRSSPQTTGGAWPFNDTGNPFYLIFNLAVGGLGTPFTGNQAFNSADFPQSFQVDYVRVYSGTWNVEFTGDPFVYKGEENKTYAVSAVSGATYNWTLPAGVTLVSGQGTNQISVTYESTAVSGDIQVSVTSGCETQVYTKAVSVEEQFQVSNILKDWDANNNMTLSSSSGTLTQEVNPAGSTNVGKYVRNAGQLYDNIIYKNVAFGNASDFLTRRRRIHMDLYTTAPVGTKVRIQLENTARSAQTFPVGRHSVYEALTTKQNGWETLEFEYVNSPDLATGSTTVDQLAILFAVETNTAHTYYIDNIVIGTAGEPCPRTLNQTLEDFQINRNITFSSSTGTLSSVVNPETGGINTSAQVGKYIRNNGELYDVLFYKDVALNNVENFRNGKAVFKMQVYTTAPVGTTISLQLETSASTPSNYPTGRHSLYQAVTAVQNQWQTLEFSFIGRLDALALDEQVNTIVFLFAPGTNTGATYHFDNLLTESETCVVVPVTGITVTPTTFSVAGGATRQLTPAVAPSNASNKSVTYSSSNTAVATVSTNGVVTGLTMGTSTITVTSVDGSFTATAEVTVTSSIAPVTGVTVSPETASFVVGATQQLTATVAPANATIKTVSWSSSNASVAGVDGSGLVTGVSPGTATITVTTQNGSQTATASITVLSIPVTGVTVSPTSSSIVINTTKQLTATLAPANATNKNVSWSSNNPAVATVNASGLVSGVAAGSATITATTQDGSHTTTSSIEVTLPVTSCSGNGPTASGQSVADYTYEITSTGSTATIKFITNTPIAGCDFVIFYWRTGSSGGFAGQGMTQSGNTFTTTVNVTSGSTISTYFTYRRGAGGMESNSSANPHLFVAGQCTGESNTLPVVTLTSPETGSTFAAGSDITISANASDAAPGSITKVEFFHGTTKIGEDTSSPYSIAWNDVPEGTYSITAKATDNQLGVTVSGAISITVSVITGVERDSDTKITLYPNPTTDIITITLGVKLEGGALKIVDGIGQEKMHRSSVVSGPLNVSTLSPGIYLLTVVQGSHKVVKRFVKR